MKSRATSSVILAALAAAALALGGCGRKASTPAPPRAVRVAPVEPYDARVKAHYTGTLEPRTQLNLAFKVGGKLAFITQVQEGGKTRSLQEGDRVKRGQLLATLDDADYRRQANAAAAGIDGAAAQERAARAALGQAEVEVERARRLGKSATISKADLDRAESNHAAAVANLQAAQAAQRSRVEQYALSRSTVAEARLVSPIDGIVSRRALDVGETVLPGVPVFTVIDTTEMRVVLGVPDVKVNALRVGQRVPVTISALPGEARVGAITKIAPTADAALRSYAAEVTLPNADGQLKAGMVASASVGGAERKGVTLVPLAAVVRAADQKGFAVYVLGPDGVAVTPRQVRIGDLHGSDVLVEAGLQAGERVVIEGAQFLRAGDKVEVTP